jgi:hypothetical protein
LVYFMSPIVMNAGDEALLGFPDEKKSAEDQQKLEEIAERIKKSNG